MFIVQTIKNNLGLTTVTAVAALLRLISLGYSDFQGDEIKAFFLPEQGQSSFEFLLSQRKGPVQFLVTYFLSFFDPNYQNQFLLRLPFALAGILAVYFFYKLVKGHFGSKTAFFSSFFLATNGFFIAFSRIVQYQSFVILFMILALYSVSLAIWDQRWQEKGIYLGFVFWALSILSHYDGGLIAPFMLFLLILWLQKEKGNFKHTLLAGVLSAGLLLIFYVPFILNIDPATKSYWLGRIEGTGGTKTSSSFYLFSVYQPIYVIHIYKALFLLGTLKIFKFLVTGNLNTRLTLLGLLLWFLTSFWFLEGFVTIPGTHIYTYLLPLFIFLGFGIVFIEESIVWTLNKLSIKEKLKSLIVSYLVTIGVTVMLLFIFFQSYAIYVDHLFEYPWENEKFLIWEFHKPSSAQYHLSLFGFPYYRHWEEIGEFIAVNAASDYHSTNERKTIVRHHVTLGRSTDKAGYFIYIYHPQSFIETGTAKSNYWMQNHEPVKSFYNKTRVVSEIYLMPEGNLDQIKQLEY